MCIRDSPHDAHEENQRVGELAAVVLSRDPVGDVLDVYKRQAQNLDLALLENPLLGQLHGEVQARLSAQSRNDGVGALVADDLGDVDVYKRQGIYQTFLF